jgi:RND family efflux transporter MFP subunit
MITIHTIETKFRELDKKALIAGIAVIALAAIAGIGYRIAGKQAGTAGPPAAAEPVAVPVVTVEPRTIESVVTAAGALTSRNTSVLSSKVMGRVSYLGVQEGDHVSAGKLLIRIDSGEIAAQAFQAQAAYNNARLQYDRIKSLYDAEASTQMEMDQATLGLESAKAGLNAARSMESYTTIAAPITGQIMEKRINLGEMAIPGQPLLKIEDNRNLRLEVTVREQDILHIRPGAAVNVQIDAMAGKTIKGKVAMVVPASDVRTHSFIVKVDVPAAKGLITGMYGKAFFPTGRREAIVVPRDAVVEMSGISGVYVVSAEGSAVFQMVQLGEEQENAVEVVSGLKKGDRVVADRKSGRIDGKRVVPAEQ